MARALVYGSMGPSSILAVFTFSPYSLEIFYFGSGFHVYNATPHSYHDRDRQRQPRFNSINIAQQMMQLLSIRVDG